MKTMGNGYYEDILSWINSESVKDKLFRVWFLDDLDINDLCIYEYFTQMICLPDGDVLIGMQEYDRKKKIAAVKL